MTDLEIDMRDGKARLQEIRDEVGFDPHDDEPSDPEALNRYVEALEANVVGTVAAMKGIARSMRRPT